MLTMLPKARMAKSGEDQIEVIGLWTPPATSDEGEDQWLAIDVRGKAGYYSFADVRFDGWLL